MVPFGLGAVLSFDSEGAIGSMGRAKKGFDDLSGAMTKLTLVGAGIGVGMGIAAKSATEFGKGVAEVQTIADGAQFPIETIRKLSFDMANQFGGDATKQAKALYQAISSGASTAKQATDVLTVGNKLAIGSLSDAFQSVDVLTTAVNSYESQNLSAQEAADVLFKTIELGKTTMQELAPTVGRVARTAADSGVSFGELGAALGAATASGVMTESAVAGLRGALTNILKPSRKAIDEAERLGLEFNATALKTKGLGGFMADLAVKTGGSTESLAQLFGSVEGIPVVMSMISGTRFPDFLEKMKGSAGKTEEAFRVMSQTSAFQNERLMALTKTVLIFIGEAIAPLTRALREVLIPTFELVIAAFQGQKNAMTPFVEGAKQGVADMIALFTQAKTMILDFMASVRKNVSPETLAQIGRIGAIVAIGLAGLAPLAGVIGGIVFAVKSLLIPVIAGAVNVIAGLAGALAAVFWPVVAIVGVLSLAFLALRNEGESVGDTLLRFWEGIKTFALDAWNNGIKPFVDGLTSAFVPALEVLKEAWTSIAETVGFVFRDLFDFFTAGADGTRTDWLEVGRTIGAVLGAVASTVATIVAFLVKGIGLAITTFVKLGTTIVEALALPLTMVWNLAKQTLAAFGQFITGDFSGAFARLGKALLDFLVEPLRAVIRIAVRASDALNMKVPKEVRDFVNKEYAGPVIPEIPPSKTPAARAATAEAASSKAAAAIPPKIENRVTVEDKKTINVKTDLSIDGSKVASAVGRHKVEIQERAGFKASPWSRRMTAEHGAVPVPGGG